MNLVESQNITIKVIIPENLDLPALVEKHKPNFCFKLDRCLYILNQMTEQLAYNRRLTSTTEECPYVPLSSKMLVRQVRDYQYYLRYLVSVGVLESDGWYEVGHKCKGYRYTEQYQAKFITIKVSDKKLIKRNRQRVNEISQPAMEEYPELIQWFAELKLDEEAAISLTEAEYAKSSPRKKAKAKAFKKYVARMAMVNRFVNSEPVFLIDSKAHRLHTKLTNFWGKLRPYLTYKGHRLVAVDLSCSQPYLSTVLLQDFFYSNESNGRLTMSQLPESVQTRLHCELCEGTNINYEQITKEIVMHNGVIVGYTQTYLHPHTLPLYQAYPTPHLTPQPPKPPITSLMLALLDREPGFEEELQLFKSSVEQGRLYEMLGECIYERTGKLITERQQLKDLMFSVFFSDNNATKEFIKRACDIFSQTFPHIYSVFRKLKVQSNSDLAILLQGIEAEIFLNRIARRISREKPYLPIFTLHDSIVTIDGYQDYVREVMRQELYQATGVEPHFKQEEWTT